MKRLILYTTLALAQSSLWNHDALALKYSSVASGSFSSAATWLGGAIPPVNFNAGDTILIDNGHNVILDQDITLTHALAQLDVRGILRSSGSEYINFNGSGTLSVSGTLDIDSMALANVTNANITGQCMVKKIRCLIFSATGSGTFTITERLHLYGSISNTGGNTISIAPNAEIYMLGGEIIPTGTGIFTLPNSYDVIYTNSAHVKPTGIEATGTGLRHVTVDLLSDTSELKLGADLYMNNGTLTLTRGIMALNNNNLYFSGSSDLSPTGTGVIKSTSGSDIEITNTNGLSGELRFASGGNVVDDFVINTNATNAPRIGSDLKITGVVDLQQGKLNVQNHKLSLITGATVNSADANKYIITGMGGTLSADIGSGTSFTYHVGTAAQYAPCVITSNNNTVYNGLSVGVNPGVRVFGTSGNDMAGTQPMVNATWFITHSNPVVDIDMELMWASSMEVNSFDRDNAFISHLVGSYWDKDTDKAATLNANGLYALKRTGIKSLSPFAIFDKNTVDVTSLAAKEVPAIYPNPAGETLHIRWDVTGTGIIANSTGQVVKHLLLQKGENTIDISALQPGIYYLRLSNEAINRNNRFIKQ